MSGEKNLTPYEIREEFLSTLARLKERIPGLVVGYSSCYWPTGKPANSKLAQRKRFPPKTKLQNYRPMRWAKVRWK